MSSIPAVLADIVNTRDIVNSRILDWLSNLQSRIATGKKGLVYPVVRARVWVPRASTYVGGSDHGSPVSPDFLAAETTGYSVGSSAYQITIQPFDILAISTI